MALRHSARRIAAGTMLTTLATGSAVALGTPAAHAADGPQLVAHRGALDWDHYTENGTLAVENSYKSGADAVEIDIQWTKDARTVVMHDVTMNRTTNCSGTVTKISYDTFRSCKLEDGSAAPSIFDMLELADTYKRHVFLHVRELDSAAKAHKIVHALEKYGMNNRERATVISTNKPYLETAKKYGVQARRGYLFSTEAGWNAAYSVLLPYDIPVSASKVKAAQKAGKQVIVVEGHPTKLTDVLDLHLDGFLANRLQKALIELGRALATVEAQAKKLAG